MSATNPIAGPSTQTPLLYHPFENTREVLLPAPSPLPPPPLKTDMEMTLKNGQPTNSQGENGKMLREDKMRSNSGTSEDDHFQRLINVGEFRLLIYYQALASFVIFLSQIFLYLLNWINRYANTTSAGSTGIGIWVPIALSLPTFLLSFKTLQTVSSYSLINAMICQIMSFIMGIVVIREGILYKFTLGRYVLDKPFEGMKEYDPEGPETFTAFFFITGAAYVTLISLIVSIQYGRVIYCRRRQRGSNGSEVTEVISSVSASA